VEVTPQVAGTVIAVGADDTDRVQAGQMLVQLDPADAQVALDQAEAELARAVREVRTLYANNLALDGQARMLSTIDLFWLSGVLFLALAALVWLANAPRAAAKMAATPGSHE
jgi:multidrug efflux pump subunit AcrA (membrane-fusion protein)